jgi:hypothetical protein
MTPAPKAAEATVITISGPSSRRSRILRSNDITFGNFP